MILSAFILWIIPVILSLITVYLVYRIYFFDRLDKSWLFVAVGFLLIVVLRILTLLNGEGFFPEFFKSWRLYDPLLRIANSICFIIGFFAMLRNFENFDVIEKKVKSKILRNKK